MVKTNGVCPFVFTNNRFGFQRGICQPIEGLTSRGPVGSDIYTALVVPSTDWNGISWPCLDNRFGFLFFRYAFAGCIWKDLGITLATLFFPW